MEKQKFEDLLETVSTVIKGYQEEKNRLKEGFNFFQILGIIDRETYHSKFIAELLNPKGSHGCGDIFLNIFLSLLPDLLKSNVKSNDNISVKTEWFIGDIPDDFSRGGYIDILLNINQHVFLIENKINARDQRNQIFRYNQHKVENLHYKSCNILYLTIDGKIPSTDSRGDLILKEHFYCISYKHHIFEWLKLCVEQSSEHPLISETIKGYLTVIKFLTNQTSEHKMQNEIKQILFKDRSYFNAAVEMGLVINKIKDESYYKVQKINQLLKNYKFEENIGRTALVSDCKSEYKGENQFTLTIEDKNDIILIHIINEELCYATGNIFNQAFELSEPYDADEFVTALIEHLKQYFKHE